MRARDAPYERGNSRFANHGITGRNRIAESSDSKAGQYVVTFVVVVIIGIVGEGIGYPFDFKRALR
jgi:hypothetical protein